MIQNSIWEIKAQGCFIQSQFQTNFQEQSSNMTCMILSHFQSFNAVSKQLKPSKQDELMEYDQKMDMHVTICHEFNSKSNNINMHAWNELQIINNEPKHDLVLQWSMNHARTSLVATIRRWVSYLSLVFKVKELK